MIEFQKFLTDFADQGVVAPVVVAVAIILLLLGRTRLAWAWVLTLAGVFATMLLLKLAGYACQELSPAIPLAQLGLVTPSGHVAASAAAYGGMLGLMFADPAAGLRPAVLRCSLAALGIAVAVGVTRVALGDHTVAETIVGGGVGVLGAAAFAALAHGRAGDIPRPAVLSVAVACMLLFHGSHVSLETEIQTASARAVQDWLAR